MGLDMYAFSLGRSAEFATLRDVLNFRVPREGKGLPEGHVLGVLEPELLTDPRYAELKRVLLDNLPPASSFYLGSDLGGEFVDSKYVIPGSTLLHRWRKHPDLHGWMHRRFRALRAGKSEREFGFKSRVPLDVQDLDALEHAVKNRQLPHTTGLNFGASTGEEQADDLAFIDAARKELAAGKFVYYTSWW